VGGVLWIETVGYVLVFAAGVAGGLLIRKIFRPDRSREVELERELLEERDRAAAYRERVEKHFDQTAHLFRDLTNQHVALYHQIADGMRELTPDPARLPPPVFSAPLEHLSAEAGGVPETEDAEDASIPDEPEIPREDAPDLPPPRPSDARASGPPGTGEGI